MGHLGELYILKWANMKMKNVQISYLLTNRPTGEVITHLRSQLRNTEPCTQLKMCVIGPQGRGKSTVIQALIDGHMDKVKVSKRLVTKTNLTLKPSSKLKSRLQSDGSAFHLRVFELSCQKELEVCQPLFWTDDSLFLLVWDICMGSSGIDTWLSNIKVGLYTDESTYICVIFILLKFSIYYIFRAT